MMIIIKIYLPHTTAKQVSVKKIFNIILKTLLLNQMSFFRFGQVIVSFWRECFLFDSKLLPQCFYMTVNVIRGYITPN